MLIDNFAKLNRSSRNAVSAALIIVAVTVMYDHMAAPHINYLSAARQYKSVLSNIASKNELIKITNKRKENRLQELREQSAQLRSTLFTPNEVKEFFSDLEVISEEANCAVSTLSFSTTKPNHKDKRFEDLGVIANNATLNVIGTYENIIRLVEKLLMRSQGVWVDCLELYTVDYDSSQIECEMTITIYTIQNMEIMLNG